MGNRSGGQTGAFVGSTVEDMERYYRRNVPRFAPVLDGHVLPAHPFDPATPGLTADVPVVIGTTKDELENSAMNAPNLYKVTTEEELRGKAKATVGDKGPAFAELYRRKHPQASLEDILIGVGSEIRRTASITLAERKIAQGKAPVFMYRLDWESPAVYRGRRLRPSHSLDITFMFDTVDLYPGPTGGGPSARALAAKMSRSWSGFARNGNPDTSGLPHWPAYALDTRATMVFDNESKVVNDLDQEERLLAKDFPSIPPVTTK